MKVKFVHNLAAFSCLFISTMGLLQGVTSGSWIGPTGGQWDNTANWVTFPSGAFPNNIGDIADFTVPVNSDTIITTSTSITIGSLHVNSPGLLNDFTINFPSNNTLTFDNSNSNFPATLYVVNTNLNIGTLVDTPTIILNSELEIFIKDGNSTNIISSISGSGPVSFAGADSGTLTFVSPNSYSLGTNVMSGRLFLDSALGNAIPGNFELSGFDSLLIANSHDDQFAHTAKGVLTGFSGMLLTGTNQTLQSLFISRDSFVEGGNVLTLNTLGDALIITGNGSIEALTISLVNGAIFYHSINVGDSGQGLIGFPQSAPPQAITIDFNGTDNSIICNGPSNFPYDLNLHNVNIINNPFLNFAGFGIIELSGTLGSIPPGSLVVDVNLQIGDPSSTTIVGMTGTMTLEGSLGGFGTLGTSGLATVNNSFGFVQPGFPTVPGKIGIPGTFTISGSYLQDVQGQLIIKSLGFGVGETDKLVVEEGTVSLAGSLIFEGLPGNTLAVGEEFVIIDNSTGSAPIAGTFSEVQSIIPQGLGINVIYNPQQVIVQITSSNPPCPPCPAFMLLPPTDLKAKLIKNVFLTETEKFIRLTFHPSPSENLKEYRIYRDGKLIGVLKATLHFDDHVKIRNVTEKYSVTSVSTSGVESAPVITFFTPPPRC